MTYQAKNTASGWSVANAAGCLLSEDGHSFLRGDGSGTAKIFSTESRAAAVAEWLNSRGSALSKAKKRDLRAAICEKHGIPAIAANGLLQ